MGGDRLTVPALETGECQVWWATLAPVRAAHLAVLDPVERDRRDAYRRDADRDRFTIGVVLTRLILAAHVRMPARDVPLDRACMRCGRPHGRPVLPDAGLALSISHAEGRIGFACGRVAAIGLDVEKIRTSLPTATMIRHVLAAEEAAALTAGVDPDRDFTTYWTRKEAILKATGDGLRVPMPTVRVSDADHPPALEYFAGRPDLVADTWMAALTPGPGYVGTLAVIGSQERTPVAELDADPLLATIGVPAPTLT